MGMNYSLTEAGSGLERGQDLIPHVALGVRRGRGCWASSAEKPAVCCGDGARK